MEEIMHANDDQKRLTSLTIRKLTNKTISKEWCRKGREQKTRDLILRLTDTETTPRTYTTRSDEMAGIMARHHNRIQDDNEDTLPTQRAEALAEVLEYVDTSAAEAIVPLGMRLSYDTILEALKRTPSGKAAGINGIPTELYKTMNDRWLTTRNGRKPSTDIVRVLQTLFNDIEEHGMIENTFTEGWICPIYKKGDRTIPANYRPITVLNAEYKLLTTALMIKLIKLAPDIIHESQGAFIPGRSIFNQVELIKRMIDLCESEEQNGLILALDQEKAYDKILHSYLWAVLEKLGLPDNTIHLIKSLYESAESAVMVNGELSEKFQIR